MTTIHLNLGKNGYDITVGSGILSRAGELFDLDRRVVILTDSGVPREYSEAIAKCCKEHLTVTVPMGEGSKSLETFAEVSAKLIEFGITRSDCMVAVGGGVVGDLCGFVAASYMRGIDFYNVPTTVLSQIDSSIGGKTAVNHAGIKNIIGAFHQPRGVLIDLDTQKTLTKRQISGGICEAIKMAATFDADLFKKFEETNSPDALSEELAVGALMIKKRVVEEDERESGIRKALNFGHTFGHAVEAKEEMTLYHGECVAIGMPYMCSEEVRQRLVPLLSRLGLPTKYDGDIKGALEFVIHDKKCNGSTVNAVICDRVGEFRICPMTVADFSKRILSYK